MFADEEPITTPHPALTAHEATVSAPSPAFVGSPATPPEAGPTAVSTIAVPTGRAPAGGRRAAPPVSLMLGIAVAFLVAGGIRWLAEWRMNAPAAATTSTGSDATAGTPPPAPSVESLLAGAAGDLAALRLTVPTGHNALEKYRAVLDRDTDNAAALAGIDLIVGRYIDLAAAAAQTGDLASARDYLDRARSVNPDDSRLRSAYLALERSARRASRTASES
jgi:hypothetical protein